MMRSLFSVAQASNFANALVNLHEQHLSLEQKSILVILIDFLVQKMDAGNSCTYLAEFIDYYHQFIATHKNESLANTFLSSISLPSLLEILQQSSICTFIAKDALVSTLTTPNDTPNTKSHTLDKLLNTPLSQRILVAVLDDMHYPLAFGRYFSYECYTLGKLNRLACASNLVVNDIASLLAKITNNNSSTPEAIVANSEQLQAVKNSASNRLSFISGGPGTGKTTTVLMLLVTLLRAYSQDYNPPELDIKIVAPTGKAVNRVKQALSNGLSQLETALAITQSEKQQLTQIECTTIHRLLGYRHNSIYFKHNQSNPLQCQVLIIDESSMISLPLMYKLLTAIDITTIKHIVFLGDKNQLSSVEEGYVFGSLMRQLGTTAQQYTHFCLSLLTTSHRNTGDIQLVAQALLVGDSNQVLQLLAASSTVRLCAHEHNTLLNEILQRNYFHDYLQAMINCDASVQSIELLFSCFYQSAILCATNHGDYGVNKLNSLCEELVKQKLDTKPSTWYTGRPVLVLENNATLEVYNGDIGICVMVDNKPIIYFANNKHYALEALPQYQLAYAITIHKAQGSEYRHVDIILPDLTPTNKQLLSRELVYTALTRAKQTATIFAPKEALTWAVEHHTARTSLIEALIIS